MAAGIAMPPAIRRRRGGHSTGTGRTAAGSERPAGGLRGGAVVFEIEAPGRAGYLKKMFSYSYEAKGKPWLKNCNI
jgi:hypothetical protein